MVIQEKVLMSGYFNKLHYFIAEIGLNHNGDSSVAEQMIVSAAEAGADAVKFQTYIPEKMYSSYTKSLLESGREGESDRSIIDFFGSFCLSEADLVRLKRIAYDHGVECISSPFDLESVDLLEKIGVKFYKVASSEVTHLRLLERIAETKKPVVLSTGMTHSDEIAKAISILKKGTSDIVLLHCVSLYPVPLEQINLARMKNLSQQFVLPVGFSDHTPDIESSYAAICMGATVIEKHFTLSRDFKCPDGNVSVTPDQFKTLIDRCKKYEIMNGDGKISFKTDEEKVAKSSRRSLYASRDIMKGEILDVNDIIEKRPGIGISSADIYRIIGKRSMRNISKDHLIREEFLEN
jgi:N,N'-diacetyllegionaminate synthase